jgi:hypothetical protein
MKPKKQNTPPEIKKQLNGKNGYGLFGIFIFWRLKN